MAETTTKTATLTHKVRNPQKLEDWLNIWTATVSADFDENNTRTNEKIVIKPSDNWQITADKLGTIPVTKIVDANDKHNVTASSSIGSNVLTKTDGNGNLVAGPTISTSDEHASYFLNQKGEWAQINTSFTVDLKTITEGDQTTISNAEFKVGNNSVIVKPQGKLAFSDVSTNKKEIKLSLGLIETTDLNLTATDPNDPSKKKFRLSLENIADLPENSAEVTGMVKYGNAKESPSVWLTTKQTSNENGASIDNYVPDWGQIQTDHIADNAVTEAKIVNGSVTTNKIANNAVTEVKIANGSVTTNKIVDSAVTETKIADGSVTEGKIANGSVTGDKLSDTAITDKFDTKLLGTVINTDKPILQLENPQEVPDTGYYPPDTTNYPVKTLISTASSPVILQKGNNQLRIDKISFYKDKCPESEYIGYYHKNSRYVFSLSSAWYLDFSFIFNKEGTDITIDIKNAPNVSIKESNCHAKEYLVPSVEELALYYTTLDTNIRSAFDTLKNDFNFYMKNELTGWELLTTSELRNTLRNKLNMLWDDISSNLNIPSLNNENPLKEDYKNKNQLNEWDYNHLGIWVEI